MLEISVLGPIEASRDGEPVPLGGPKQQAVLAHLVVHQGERLSADRCIHAVWGESPPSGAQRSLQTYVSNLRKVLDPEPRGRDRELISGTRQGYLLDLSDASLDATALRRLEE